MPTTIKLKNSVTTTNAPSSLAQGEVAINITDKKVWVGNAATTPIQLVGDGGSASFTSIAFGAGTVSNPSITTTGDTNTGIYFPAADTIAFTEGGVESMRIDSSGNVGIGTTSTFGKLSVASGANSNAIGMQQTDSSNTSQSIGLGLFSGNLYGTKITALTNYGSALATNLTFSTTDSGGSTSERMRIDSSGNVGINTSSPAARLDVTGSGRFFGTTGNVKLSVTNNGGETTIARDDSTGSQFGVAYATNIYANGAYPMMFWTNGSERMRILSTGNILSLSGGSTTATGTGISFPATQSASSDANTLDDYEEGTWTPTLGGTATYNGRTGSYVKVGQLVTVSFDVDVAIIGTGSKRIISGLPFTVSTGNSAGGGIGYYNSTESSVVSIFARVDGGATTVILDANTAASTASGVPNLFQSGTRIIGAITYRASA